MDAAFKRKKQAKLIRVSRKVHRFTGLMLFIFFLLIGITGLLLGWKKQTGLLPATAKGISANASAWLPVDHLKQKANTYLQDSIKEKLSLELDRIDIRPQKGIAKFVYADHFWEVQLDCTDGSLLHFGKRNSDIIEQIHDASLADRATGTGNDFIKLFYTTVMGLAVIIFSLTGFWLWYGPKRMRHH